MRSLSTTILPADVMAAGWLAGGRGTGGRAERRLLARRLTEDGVQGFGQGLGLGVLHLVGEERLLHGVAVLGVEDAGPLLDVVELGRVVDEDDELVGGLQRQQRDDAGVADADAIAFGDEHRVEFVREDAHGEEVRLQDEALATLQHGLVEHLHHVDGAGDDVRAAAQEQGGAAGLLVDVDVLALEGAIQPGAHEVRLGDAHRHQLEDGAVGGGHVGQRPAADQQRDVGDGDLVALEEGEDAALLPRVDAVGA